MIAGSLYLCGGLECFEGNERCTPCLCVSTAQATDAVHRVSVAVPHRQRTLYTVSLCQYRPRNERCILSVCTAHCIHAVVFQYWVLHSNPVERYLRHVGSEEPQIDLLRANPGRTIAASQHQSGYVPTHRS
eukprot:3336542-Rhodomonas_salina.2